MPLWRVYSCPWRYHMLAKRFPKLFLTMRFSSKLPPRLESVATLPCEIFDILSTYGGRWPVFVTLYRAYPIRTARPDSTKLSRRVGSGGVKWVVHASTDRQLMSCILALPQTNSSKPAKLSCMNTSKTVELQKSVSSQCRCCCVATGVEV